MWLTTCQPCALCKDGSEVLTHDHAAVNTVQKDERNVRIPFASVTDGRSCGCRRTMRERSRVGKKIRLRSRGERSRSLQTHSVCKEEHTASAGGRRRRSADVWGGI